MNQVSSQELQRWIDVEKDFLLIDVREDWERDAYNIGGVHIPMGALMSRLAEIPKDKVVVFYCEKGIRSVIVVQRLEGMGYHKLFNLSGGMQAWKESQWSPS